VGGKDGKPLFISGPYDDVPRIMARLEKAVGRGGLHFLTRVDQMPDWGIEVKSDPDDQIIGLIAKAP